MNMDHTLISMKFAAGELSLTEENEFLLTCEIEPELWRDLALQFVEVKRIGQAFAEEDQQEPAQQRNRRFGVRMPLRDLLVTCLGICIGVFSTLQWHPAAAPVASLPERSSVDPDVYYIVLDDEETTEDIASTSSLENQLAGFFTPIFHQAEQDALRNAGFMLNDEPVLYLISDEQGNQYAMPHRTISVSPVEETLDQSTPL